MSIPRKWIARWGKISWATWWVFVALASFVIAYNSTFEGSQVDEAVSRALNLQAAVGDPGDDDEIVSEEGIRNTLADYEPVDADIAKVNEAESITGTWEIQDNVSIDFGNDSDIDLEWDTDLSGLDDWTLTGGGFKISGTDASQDIKLVLENANGTYGFDLYVHDVLYGGVITSMGSGDSYVDYSNNTSIACSGYRQYYEATELVNCENGTEYNPAMTDQAETVSSAWDFSAGLTSTTGTFSGTLSGELATSPETSASVDLSTASNCRGKFYYNNDADVITFVLPPVEDGLNCCFGAGTRAEVVTVDPDDGTDTIILNGTAASPGEAIESSGSAGDFICLLGLGSTYWITLGRSGSWVEETP